MFLNALYLNLLSLQNFLQQNEFKSQVVRVPTSNDSPLVSMIQLTASWDERKSNNVLTNINFELNRGDLLIVTGQVGSGKVC